MKYIITILVLGFYACGEDVSPLPETEFPPVYGDIVIETFSCNQDSLCPDPDALAGVEVLLYANESDRENGVNVLRRGFSSVDGKIRFNALESFWVYIISESDTLKMKSEERLPMNTITFHQIYFP